MIEHSKQYSIIGVLLGHNYLASWNIEEMLGIERTSLGGCGSAPTKWTTALKQLEQKGLVEELPDLGCRYRLTDEKLREPSFNIFFKLNNQTSKEMNSDNI